MYLAEDFNVKLANVTLDQCYKIFMYWIETQDIMLQQAAVEQSTSQSILAREAGDMSQTSSKRQKQQQ